VGDTELSRRPVVVRVVALCPRYQVSSYSVNESAMGGERNGTYEAEVEQYESVVEVGERLTRGNGRVRLGGGGDHGGIHTGHRASSKPTQSPFSMTATSHPRPLTLSMISLRRWTSTRSRGRMFRQRIVRQLMPVLTMRSTRESASCCAVANLQVRGDADPLVENPAGCCIVVFFVHYGPGANGRRIWNWQERGP
jgi:hypothetical protein